MTDPYRDFLESWATEIESRAARVRTLIGDRHWVSDGQHKEFLIREFLTRYLPPPIRVGHGFMRTHLPNADCSPEIDVLVTNPSKHPLFFDEGGLQIAPISSVRAAIEVKTTFGLRELTQALQRIAYIRLLIHMDRPSNDIWLGAVFYRSNRPVSANSALKLIEKCYRNISQNSDLFAKCPKNEIHDSIVPVPTCICLSGQLIAFFRREQESSCTTQIDIFESKSLSFALAAIDLISAVAEGNEPTALELASSRFGLDRVATTKIVIGRSER